MLCIPLTPNFYIVKLEFTGVYIFITYFCPKIRLWVLVRTASLTCLHDDVFILVAMVISFFKWTANSLTILDRCHIGSLTFLLKCFADLMLLVIPLSSDIERLAAFHLALL